MPGITRIVSLIGLLFLFSLALQAQLDTASLVGTVKDATGAVVPNATVTVKDIGKGGVRTTTTDANEDYIISNFGA